MELEIWKAYMKIYLKKVFIQPLKLPAWAFIQLNKKRDSNLCLYVDYQDHNNLIVKIYIFYLLLAIFRLM